MTCTRCGEELWDSIERAHRLCVVCCELEVEEWGEAAASNDDTQIVDYEDESN